MTDALKKLDAAMMAPESGVNEPQRRRSSSFAAQVFDLTFGETASRVQRVESSHAFNDTFETLPYLRDKLRNNCAPAVKQAKAKIDGADYKIEVTDLLTPGGSLFVIALVTRTA